MQIYHSIRRKQSLGVGKIRGLWSIKTVLLNRGMNKDTEMWVSTVCLGNAHHLVVTWTSLFAMDSTRIRILDLSHMCLFTCFPVSSHCSYSWAVSDSSVLCLWNGWWKVFCNKLKKKRVRDPPSCLILGIELKLYPSQWLQVGKYNEID